MNVNQRTHIRYLFSAIVLLALTPSSFALSWIEKNAGQVAASYDYVVRANDLTALTSSAYVDLLLTKETITQTGTPNASEPDQGTSIELSSAQIRMEFMGAERRATLGAASQLASKSNYFKGSKDQWISNVPHFDEVRYEDIYPGIDVVYKLSNGQLEYDFIVAPGADSSVIALSVSGADSVLINENGHLEATTSLGTLTQSIPAVYQLVGGEKRLVEGAFEVNENGRIGFVLDEHEENHVVVIDPVIEFAGYFGGNRSDSGSKLQQKANGNLVLLGSTTSLFEPTGTPSDFRVSSDVFVAELDQTTGDLLWVTVLGGSRRDASENFHLDSQGNPVVVGYTSSSDFPTANAIQPVFLGNNTLDNSVLNSDGFVTKLSADGSTLIFSTFLGGTDFQIQQGQPFGFELFRGIDIDSQDNIYIVGQTASTDYPTTTTFNGFGCFEQELAPDAETFGTSSDIAFTKLSSAGGLLFSTCIGGSARDAGRSVLVRNDGTVYISGFTRSSDFPTTLGAFQTTPIEIGEITPFVLKLSSDYSQITTSSLVGEGFLQTIDVDANDDIYGVISSRGATPATPGAFQETPFELPEDFLYSDGFVFKLSADGTAMLYGTYLGAVGNDSLSDIRVDNDGRAYIAGQSSSPSYPLKNPITNPIRPILRNVDVSVPSSGYNHIARTRTEDLTTVISLLSRDGTNQYAFGDGASLGDVVSFSSDGSYNTSAMAFSQAFPNPGPTLYAGIANRDGPNQLFSFNFLNSSLDEFITSSSFGNDSRAVEAEFVTTLDGVPHYYFGNYGEPNVLVRLTGFPPSAIAEPTGRTDGNTTALTQLSLVNQGVLTDHIVVANENQDIRLYDSTFSTLGPANILGISVGPVTALAAGDFDGDNQQELVVASDDRAVEVVEFTDTATVDSVQPLAGTETGNNLSLLVVDIDDDGDVDIVVGRLGDDKLFLNDGSGNFIPELSYTGNSEATKALSTSLPAPLSQTCPCFGVTDSSPQELLTRGAQAVVSVLNADGSDLEFSTFLGSGGNSTIFRGLDFANGSDSKILIAGFASGDDWPLVTSSTPRNEAGDAVFMVLELDQDGDNALDGNDNCTLLANSNQIDTDADGYGNACDADFNNDCTVNFLDISAFANEFLGTNPLFDINGDGAVNFLDFSAVSTQFLNSPGPGLGNCEPTP